MRPLQFVTEEEWKEYWRKNKPLRDSWENVEVYAKARDPRGARTWMFMWGWASCERHYRNVLQELDARLETDVEKAVERFMTEWQKRSRLRLLVE